MLNFTCTIQPDSEGCSPFEELTKHMPQFISHSCVHVGARRWDKNCVSGFDRRRTYLSAFLFATEDTAGPSVHSLLESEGSRAQISLQGDRSDGMAVSVLTYIFQLVGRAAQPSPRYILCCSTASVFASLVPCSDKASCCPPACGAVALLGANVLHKAHRCMARFL